MTTFQLYDRVVSRVDLPDFGIQAGTMGTIVDLHPDDAFEVDFGLDADGNIVTAGLDADQLSPLPAVSTQAA
jgi:hypothetical protein